MRIAGLYNLSKRTPMKKGKLYFKLSDKKKYILSADDKTEIPLRKGFMNDPLQPGEKADVDYEEEIVNGVTSITRLIYKGKSYPNYEKQRMPQNQNNMANNNQSDPAKAPYNFVPLNETVIEAQPIPNFDKYYDIDENIPGEINKRYTGTIELAIETITPIFIRGENENFFMVNVKGKPVIPGSSLRGMVRTLVEIISFSKFSQYNNRAMYYRSTRNDYKVFAGYLFKVGDDYKINPAIAELINNDNQIKYQLQSDHQYQIIDGSVYFSVGEFANEWKVWKFTQDTDEPALPLPDKIINSYISDEQRDEDVVDLIKSLAEQIIVNHKSKEINGNNASFSQGIPIFYTLNDSGHVYSIGHCKYHRVPYQYDISEHVLPKGEHNKKEYDFPEAIFGFLKKKNNEKDERKEFSSRVFFEDATTLEQNWQFNSSPSLPKILATPKPTSHQLYLNQKEKRELKKWDDNKTPIRGNKLYWHKSKNGDWQEMQISFSKEVFAVLLEENKITPNEFGESLTMNQKAEINLDKLPDSLKPIILTAIRQYEKQHTIIKPVKDKVTFTSRIRYENLTAEELGCLLFILDLPKECCHKIGMCKPLGLGSVAIKPTLLLSDRQKRYEKLFEVQDWYLPLINNKTIDNFKNDFETYMLKKIHVKNETSASTLWEIPRLKQLKTLLSFEPPDSIKKEWLDRTGYQDLAEFVERRVLPYPDEVIKPETY